MSHRPGVAHRKTFPCPYCKKQTQDVNRHMRSCREAKAAVAARAASHRFAFMTLSGFNSDIPLSTATCSRHGQETAPASALTPRSEPVNSATPAPAPACDPDQMTRTRHIRSHSCRWIRAGRSQRTRAAARAEVAAAAVVQDCQIA